MRREMLGRLVATALSLVPAGLSAAPAVTIAPMCDGHGPAERLLAVVADGLARDGWQVQHLGHNHLAPARPCLALTPKQLRRKLELATSLFYDLNLDESHQCLDDLLDYLRDTHRVDQASDVYLEALVFSAWIALENHDLPGANLSLAAAGRYRPSWSPPDNRFPPIVIDAYRAQTASVLAQARGTLDIDVQPAGSAVSLDGLQQCQSPCHLDDLLPGEHFVRVQHPDLPPHVATVTVAGGHPATLTGVLADDVRSHLLQRTGGAPLDTELQRRGLAELVLALEVSAPGNWANARILRPRAGYSDSLTLRLEAVTTSASTLRAALARARDVDVPSPSRDDRPPPPRLPEEDGDDRPPPPRLPEDDGWLAATVSSWWFWGGVGIVLAAIAVGATVALTRNDDMRLIVEPR